MQRGFHARSHFVAILTRGETPESAKILATAAANLKTAILTSLGELMGTPPAEFLEKRYRRFRLFGTPGQQPAVSDAGEGV